jgi:hypothetical protein
MSRCCRFVVDSTANPEQIETVEYGFRLVHNRSKNVNVIQYLHAKCQINESDARGENDLDRWEAEEVGF